MIQNTIQGQRNGENLKIAVVVSRFNEFITSKLLEGCVGTLSLHGVSRENIVVVWVPGAFEIPFAATQLVDSDAFDAVICLGAIVRGETPHFDYVAGESAKGIGKLNQEGHIPVIYGIITTDTMEQAIDRTGGKAGNKGSDAAVTAIEMATLAHALSALKTAESPADSFLASR